MSVKKVRILAEQRLYKEALALSSELLEKRPEDCAEILRARAYVFCLIGDYGRAIQDRETILALQEAELGDYYLAGDNAISSADFRKAVKYLQKVLIMGKEQNEKWFESASYFLLAYAQCELGEYDSALESIDLAIVDDPDCAMPIPGLGVWDHHRLRREIHRRKNLAEN